MLSSYLTALPYTKLVLIEDSLSSKAAPILDNLLDNYERRTETRVCYFTFQSRSRCRSSASSYDFTHDSRNWLNPNGSDFGSIALGLSEECVVVVDSLAHVLYRYGAAQTYEIFARLKNRTNVQQIVAVLHTDLLKDKKNIVRCFHHLATLHMELDSDRVAYTYKKSPRKIIKEIEEYRFESGRFITEAIKKPDKSTIVHIVKETVPEELSTFKISLSDKDKELRDNLVLPYLPKDNEQPSGKIHYSLDAVDDWDEEDPDDDLDI